MDRLLADLIGFLLIASVGSRAAPTPQQYWNFALPNTPMPSSLSRLLDTPAGGSTANLVETGHVKPGGTMSAGVGKGIVGIGVKAGSGAKPNGITVGIHNGDRSPFLYNYAATESQLHEHAEPNVALFFLEKDLHPGKKLTVHFTATTAGAKFLPRSEADAIPFSSDKVPEIHSRFSVEPDCVEAAEMAQTLHDCEEPAMKGEKKACATSLESMVDFAVSSLGTNQVRAVSTVVGKEGTPKQEYTMIGVKRTAGADDQLVACHPEPYAYAVFSCHLTQATKAYTVSMAGDDGKAVEAVAVCHTDTNGWNPKHVAFRVLNVQPGTVPVCHLLPQDHVVWTSSGSRLDVRRSFARVATNALT